jgi:hypothetical protein
MKTPKYLFLFLIYEAININVKNYYRGQERREK